MAKSAEFPQYNMVTPRSFTKGRKSGQPTVIVIHTTEGSEGITSAADGAAYDARRTDGTSTHFFVDQDGVVQCVLTTDEAHAARAHGNDVGIQLELCGRAGQTAAQWADAASAGTLEQAARLCVALRRKYGAARFPLVRLSPAQLRAGGKGFAGHVDCTNAWPEDSGTHTDPGPGFPWSKLFARISTIEQETKVASAADEFVDTLLNRKINIQTDSAKPPNMQPVGGILAYTSSEHHRAIDNAEEADRSADEATAAARAVEAAVSALRAEVVPVLQAIEARLTRLEVPAAQ